jgi:hypothetical protein
MREWRITLTALALVCACPALPQPAAAQQDFLTFRQQIRPSPPKGPSHLHRRSGDAQMRVKADGVDYDYTNHQFAAVGNVQIYYNGATIEADRVRASPRCAPTAATAVAAAPITGRSRRNATAKSLVIRRCVGQSTARAALMPLDRTAPPSRRADR